jgi:Predicted membrane protein
MIKMILYIFITPITLWAIDSINITKIFKKNRYYASRVFFLILTMALSYLVVNFLYDFYSSTTLIS